MKTALIRMMFGTLLSLTVLGAVGCGEVENKYNCNAVCDRYKDCFDADYDADTCAQNCENKANDDVDYANTVNSCEACIDDRSCSDSVFPCAAECGSVVP